VHFVAGYARGDFRAHSVAARFVFAPGHTDAPPKDLTADWVVITLAEPIGLKPIEVEAIPLDRFLGAVEEGELTRAGYGADRAHLLSMHRGCTAVAANPAGIVFHRCDSNHGDSGSPLLLFRHGVPTLVGIHVAIVKHGEEALGAAVPAASFAAAVSH
jgi:protease YdgD